MQHVVALSGGKDSVCMALMLRENNPNTQFKYIFNPTGNELPEMITHLQRMETLLGTPITHVGCGKTLKQLIRELEMLPSWRARWCTRTDCAWCPYQKLGEWRNLLQQHPDIYFEGVDIESEINHTFRSPGHDTWPADMFNLAREFNTGRVIRGDKKQNTERCAVCNK